MKRHSRNVYPLSMAGGIKSDLQDGPSGGDVEARLWKNRDFELIHLWQRSVFLTAFILACFTGYGGLVKIMLSGHCSDLRLVAADIGAIGVSILGFAFSLLWIAMARGSKAWSEWYEFALRHYCDRTRISTAKEASSSRQDESDMSDYLSPRKIAYLIRSNPLVEAPTIANDFCILHGFSGGPFSPSKINIMIGFILAAVFLLLLIAHLFLLLMSTLDGRFFRELFSISWGLFVAVILLSVIVVTCLSLTTGRWVRSSDLRHAAHSLSKKQRSSYTIQMPTKKSIYAMLLVLFLVFVGVNEHACLTMNRRFNTSCCHVCFVFPFSLCHFRFMDAFGEAPQIQAKQRSCRQK